VDKHELPHKVYTDCARCPQFPDCDEVAMVYDLREFRPMTIGKLQGRQ